MGVFKSERRFWTDVTDLRPVVDRTAEHFRGKGYTVASAETGAGAWDVDITRTGVFRTVSGMRTALKVRLEPEPGSVLARAGVGILGQQALPTVVSMLIFWPILVTQIWGAIRSAKVDDEALAVIEKALSGAPAPAPSICPHCDAPHGGGRFCTECGGALVTG
ncbi:hypothetical protein AB0M54_06360 [Actinoplanes sp. NPDC051470]|uniref:hypothetical protein n=1 Tax=Actinoplanes sp. NPDC051470 TaxID=3157224 RepID=UPI003428DE60